jgi:hypothetical protein
VPGLEKHGAESPGASAETHVAAGDRHGRPDVSARSSRHVFHHPHANGDGQQQQQQTESEKPEDGGAYFAAGDRHGRPDRG